MSETIFAKIIRREVPADIVYEDGVCLAFRDTRPQAPTHILIIPKKPIVSLADLQADDQSIMGALMLAASQIAKQLQLDGGYRLVINCGPDAGQSVDHLHVHLLAGRSLSWPPG